MGWLLKRQCPPFSASNRCALIGRIYLSLLAYSRQVALPPTNRLGLSLFWAFCSRDLGQAAGGPGFPHQRSHQGKYRPRARALMERSKLAGPFEMDGRRKRCLAEGWREGRTATDKKFWLGASHNPKITEASHVPVLRLGGRGPLKTSGQSLNSHTLAFPSLPTYFSCPFHC